MVRSQRTAIERTERHKNVVSGGSEEKEEEKRKGGSGGSQPGFCQNACIVEETDERRLMFVFSFSSGDSGEMHLGTVRMMQIAGDRGHCLIRQLKDTSAEEIRTRHQVLLTHTPSSLPYVFTLDCVGLWGWGINDV